FQLERVIRFHELDRGIFLQTRDFRAEINLRLDREQMKPGPGILIYALPALTSEGRTERQIERRAERRDRGGVSDRACLVRRIAGVPKLDNEIVPRRAGRDHVKNRRARTRRMAAKDYNCGESHPAKEFCPYLQAR